MKAHKISVSILLMLWTMTGYSVDFQNANLKEFLQDFNNDTAKVMNQLPARNGESLNIFSDEEKKGAFVDKKDQVRLKNLTTN